MRAKITYFLVIFPLLSLALAACTSSDGGEAPICNPEGEAQLPTRAENEMSWEESGTWNAATVEEASEVAGFDVVSPSFFPEDFCRGLSIHVNDPCVGLPEGLDCGPSIQVTQFWFWLGDEDLEVSQRASLILIQSTGEFSTGAVPTEVGGYPATRDYQVAQDDRPARLSLGWEIDDMYFALSGTITGPITEEVIYEVAASVEVD
jgi:hypothetical protein